MDTKSLSLSPSEESALACLADFQNWNEVYKVLIMAGSGETRIPRLLSYSQSFICKVKELTVTYLTKAVTFEQIQNVYNKHKIFRMRDIAPLIMARWNEISLIEIARAKTVDEIENIYRLCPQGYQNEALLAARAKWDRLSFEEIKNAHSIRRIEELLNKCPPHGESKRLANEKLSKLREIVKDIEFELL